MRKNELIPHLFRNEFAKLVAVLCKTYGLSNMQLAEDFVSDSFLKAAETWKLKGVPDNPTAWLYTVSKNNAKDYFKRDKLFNHKIKDQFLYEQEVSHSIDIDLSESNIKDSQLQMLFAICHPINSNQSQIVLALRVLCGLGIEEIANALLTQKEVINKRLYRAKSELRINKIELSFPSDDLNTRLNNVLSVLYLLFNEGYFSSTNHETISKELCFEAMRLLFILTENKTTNLPKTNSLMALFCFQASRFDARLNNQGEEVLYDDQDTKLWDTELIKRGEYYLQISAEGDAITKYHIEAYIAYWHSRLGSEAKNKWESILQLYNKLLQIEYSSIAALNRTYSLSKVHGVEIAINEALKLDLNGNHFYHLLLAELYSSVNKKQQIIHLNQAFSSAKREKDKRFIQSKLKSINP